MLTTQDTKEWPPIGWGLVGHSEVSHLVQRMLNRFPATRFPELDKLLSNPDNITKLPRPASDLLDRYEIRTQLAWYTGDITDQRQANGWSSAHLSYAADSYHVFIFEVEEKKFGNSQDLFKGFAAIDDIQMHLGPCQCKDASWVSGVVKVLEMSWCLTFPTRNCTCVVRCHIKYLILII